MHIILSRATFEQLKISETGAIPRRLAMITEDVGKQTEREKDLQSSFRDAVTRLEEARQGRFEEQDKIEMDTGND